MPSSVGGSQDHEVNTHEANEKSHKNQIIQKNVQEKEIA